MRKMTSHSVRSRPRSEVKVYRLILLLFVGAEVASAEQTNLIIDTRGPVQNPGMTVHVDQEGVQAPGYILPKAVALDNWTADWIGASAKPEIDSAAAICVRKEINLSQEPKKVTAWMTGDNYLLYVNGVPAARGPADSGRDFSGVSSKHRFYDCRDLTPLFHQGANALAAELIGCNGFQFEARVEYPDGQIFNIKTDASWKGIASPYLRTADLPADIGKGKRPLFDAEAEPVGWQLASFDDTAWPACEVGNRPKESLVLNELPPLMEVRYPFFDISGISGDVTVPDHPLEVGHSIIVQGNGEFVVHFNKIMAGRCGLKVRGCKGAQIFLISNETSAPGGRAYQLCLRDGLQYFESRDYYALGIIKVIVKNATKPVEIMDVSADFLSQPVEYRGSFTCSDEALNKLWKSGRWSTQICMITHHLDSPKHQEPISDYGDYLIEDLVNYYSMGSNDALARQDLRKWAWVMENANYKTFHTSYILYWLQALMNYYDYTGDKSVVEELAPNVHAVIAQFSSYIGKNGLISDAPNYMFMDWVDVSDDQNPAIKFACHHPPAVIGQGYMTALFYRALADAIRVSELTNDPIHAAKYETLRRQIAEAYQTELWDEDRGQYRDGKPFVTSVAPGKWLPADVQMESFSVQNNALAVLYNLAPTTRQSAIIETIMQNKNWDVTPYFMHFVFDSLAHADLFGKFGVAKMREYQVVPETQTVREMGPSKGDFSHGWIASPTYQMSSKILGVVPTSPGFNTFAIQPTLCGLDFARGNVPSPHGLIGVDWERKPDQFRLKVVIPPDTQSKVFLPLGLAPAPKVVSGDRIIWSGGEAGVSMPGLLKIIKVDGRLEMELATGTYEFVTTGLLPNSP